MKKIIGFDSWTEGSFHYARLVNDFKERGFELKLIHLGSWGHDQGRPHQEIIDNLPVVDIAFYGKKNFLEILKEEKPDAIIFLSTEAFAHRAFNRYANELSIPTMNLFHGLIAVQAVETGTPNHYSFFAQIQLVLSRAMKNVTKLWPVYMKALIDTHGTASEWLRFGRDIFAKVFGKYTRVVADDSRTQYCAVYTSADVPHALYKHRIKEANLRIVGNPDIMKFNLNKADFGRSCSIENSYKNIMYIDHGGSTCGLTFKSPKDYVDYLENLQKGLLKQGYKLIVKMHPSQSQTDTPELTLSKGIVLSSNEAFLADLRGCCAAIVGPSTASIIPSLMGMPLLLAHDGPFKDQEYGKVLRDYPRSVVLDDIADVHKLLNEENAKVDFSKVREWIDENSGPLPAEKMPSRVADVVSEMVKKELQVL